MTSQPSGQRRATGVQVDALDLAQALAIEATNRWWLAAWNELFSRTREDERLEIIKVASLPPFKEYGMPVALVQAHGSGALFVLFFGPGPFGRYTVSCHEPVTIGFDVSAFNPPA